MHLLSTSSAALDDLLEPIDLRQSPGDLAILSFADSDLAGIAAAWALERETLPSVRLAHLRDLRHPMSVDLWVERVGQHAKVVLVPASHTEQSALSKYFFTGPSGSFSITGIAPGDYKLFAWEGLAGGEENDPEFIKRYESQAETVAIHEGSRETRLVKVISVEAEEKAKDN